MNRTRRTKIQNQFRKIIRGTAARPRLVVYRSLNQIYAQLIDDVTGKTIVGVNSIKMTGVLTKKAEAVGQEVAKKAKEQKINTVVFDRAGFAYSGSVKILCETVRANGIKI